MSDENTNAVPVDREYPLFGERFLNTLASEDNPCRIGMFVERIVTAAGQMNPGVWWRLTDGDGNFWESRPANLRRVVRPRIGEMALERAWQIAIAPDGPYNQAWSIIRPMKPEVRGKYEDGVSTLTARRER